MQRWRVSRDTEQIFVRVDDGTSMLAVVAGSTPPIAELTDGFE